MRSSILHILGPLCLLGSSGCPACMPVQFPCMGSAPELHFVLLGPGYGTTLKWSKGNEVRDGRIMASYPDDEALAGVAIEVYHQQQRLTITEATTRAIKDEGGCGSHTETIHDLSGLAPGVYQIVHRRKTGTGEGTHCSDEGCPWTTFEGDEALVTSLTVLPPINDGGSGG